MDERNSQVGKRPRSTETVAHRHTADPMDKVTIADVPASHRFELRVAGTVAAYSEYNLLQGALMFTHTEVLPAHEGQGLGSTLAKFALDDVRRRGLHAIPVCPFIAAYIHRHPEYHDLVTENNRRAFNI